MNLRMQSGVITLGVVIAVGCDKDVTVADQPPTERVRGLHGFEI